MNRPSNAKGFEINDRIAGVMSSGSKDTSAYGLDEFHAQDTDNQRVYDIGRQPL